MTSALFLMKFQNQLLVLSHFWFPELQKKLLVSDKTVSLENEAAQQCVTMRKRARAFAATI